MIGLFLFGREDRKPRAPYVVRASSECGYEVWTNPPPYSIRCGIWPQRVSSCVLNTTDDAEEFIAELRSRQESAREVNERLAKEEAVRQDNA